VQRLPPSPPSPSPPLPPPPAPSTPRPPAIKTHLPLLPFTKPHLARHFAVTPVPLQAAEALERHIRRSEPGLISITVGGGFARVLFSWDVGFRALNLCEFKRFLVKLTAVHSMSINGSELTRSH
jgi:hypothetical protein